MALTRCRFCGVNLQQECMSSHHSLGTVYCRNNGDCTIHIAIYESSLGKVLLSEPTAESVVIRQVASMFGKVVTLQWDNVGTYSIAAD